MRRRRRTVVEDGLLEEGGRVLGRKIGERLVEFVELAVGGRFGTWSAPGGARVSGLDVVAAIVRHRLQSP